MIRLIQTTHIIQGRTDTKIQNTKYRSYGSTVFFHFSGFCNFLKFGSALGKTRLVLWQITPFVLKHRLWIEILDWDFGLRLWIEREDDGSSIVLICQDIKIIRLAGTDIEIKYGMYLSRYQSHGWSWIIGASQPCRLQHHRGGRHPHPHRCNHCCFHRSFHHWVGGILLYITFIDTISQLLSILIFRWWSLLVGDLYPFPGGDPYHW